MNIVCLIKETRTKDYPVVYCLVVPQKLCAKIQGCLDTKVCSEFTSIDLYGDKEITNLLVLGKVIIAGDIVVGKQACGDSIKELMNTTLELGISYQSSVGEEVLNRVYASNFRAVY